MSPFHGLDQTVSRVQRSYEGTVHFLVLSLLRFLVISNQSQKDKRLCQPWSNPLVLKPRPLVLEFCTLTTNFNSVYFWAQHWPIFLILRIKRIFIKNSKQSVLTTFLNAWNELQFQEIITNKFRVKVKRRWFWATKSPTYLSWVW